MDRCRRYALNRGPALVVFVSILSLAVLLSFSIRASDPDPLPRVWFVDNSRLDGIDTATNQVAFSITLQNEARALVVDPTDRSVWALRNANLQLFSEAGAELRSFNLRQISSLDHPWSLALNPYDRSVWVASENSLLHVSREGSPLLDWGSPGNIQALVLDIDESAWVLTKMQLIRLSVPGAILGSADLSAYVINPGYLAVDSLGGIAWVAAYSHLIRLNTDDLAQPPITVTLPPPSGTTAHKIDALAVHPVFGTLSTVSRDTLYLHDRQGALLRAVDLVPHGLGQIRSIAYDPKSLSLWLGGTTAIARFTNNGDFIAQLPLQKAATAIGAAPFQLQPTLSVIDPPENALTNNPRPTIRLGLGATCSGTPCVLPDPYIRSLTFDVSLNGLAVGHLFTVDGTQAQFTPSNALPDGLNVFTATATDLFGHSSAAVSGRFTIDTVPPKFIALSPADGSLFATGAVTISGQVDDAAATVILSDATGAEISAAGASFSFAVLLREGTNTFTLTARDSAGNAATVPLRLTFLVPLNLTIQSPADGTTVTTSTITASGSVQGPSGTTVTVNGQAATISGGTFTVDVALNEGNNTITAVAAAPDGRTATQTLTITRSSGGAIPPDPATIAPPNDPTVSTQLFSSTAFLYSGTNPIQTGREP